MKRHMLQHTKLEYRAPCRGCFYPGGKIVVHGEVKNSQEEDAIVETYLSQQVDPEGISLLDEGHSRRDEASGLTEWNQHMIRCMQHHFLSVSPKLLDLNAPRDIGRPCEGPLGTPELIECPHDNHVNLQTTPLRKQNREIGVNEATGRARLLMLNPRCLLCQLSPILDNLELRPRSKNSQCEKKTCQSKKLRSTLRYCVRHLKEVMIYSRIADQKVIGNHKFGSSKVYMPADKWESGSSIAHHFQYGIEELQATSFEHEIPYLTEILQAMENESLQSLTDKTNSPQPGHKGDPLPARVRFTDTEFVQLQDLNNRITQLALVNAQREALMNCFPVYPGESMPSTKGGPQGLDLAVPQYVEADAIAPMLLDTIRPTDFLAEWSLYDVDFLNIKRLYEDTIFSTDQELRESRAPPENCEHLKEPTTDDSDLGVNTFPEEFWLSQTRVFPVLKLAQLIFSEINIQLPNLKLQTVFHVMFEEHKLALHHHMALVDTIKLLTVVKVLVQLFKPPGKREFPPGFGVDTGYFVLSTIDATSKSKSKASTSIPKQKRQETKASIEEATVDEFGGKVAVPSAGTPQVRSTHDAATASNQRITRNLKKRPAYVFEDDEDQEASVPKDTDDEDHDYASQGDEDEENDHPSDDEEEEEDDNASDDKEEEGEGGATSDDEEDEICVSIPNICELPEDFGDTGSGAVISAKDDEDDDHNEDDQNSHQHEPFELPEDLGDSGSRVDDHNPRYKSFDIRCDQCSVSFKTLTLLDAHTIRWNGSCRFHRLERHYPCIHCKDRFTSVEYRDEHETDVCRERPPTDVEDRMTNDEDDNDEPDATSMVFEEQVRLYKEVKFAYFLDGENERMKCMHLGCDAAPKEAYDQLCIKSHIVHCHPSELPFVCSERGCKKSFAQLGHLNRHWRSAHGEAKFKCEVDGCGFEATLKETLALHMLTHASERPYVCQDCGRGFNQPATLKHHQYVHTGESPFECDVCRKGYHKKSQMEYHRKRHLPLRAFICTVDECGKSFDSETDRDEHASKVHIVKVGLFVCDEPNCNETYKTLAGLSTHKTSKHSTALTKHMVTKHPGRIAEKPSFECDVSDCGKKYTTRWGLTRHTATKHPERIKDTSD
ncbi:unnamed protein product [Alternaria alternata]